MQELRELFNPKSEKPAHKDKLAATKQHEKEVRATDAGPHGCCTFTLVLPGVVALSLLLGSPTAVLSCDMSAMPSWLSHLPTHPALCLPRRSKRH